MRSLSSFSNRVNGNLRLSFRAAKFVVALTSLGLASCLHVQTNDYSGLWDIDLDGNFRAGDGRVAVDAGDHKIRTGSAIIGFSVDSDGRVTMGEGFDVSADSGEELLSLKTIPITFETGDYAGHWQISRVRDPLTGYTDFAPFSDIVSLVPADAKNHDGSIGAQYRISIGYAGTAMHINVQGDSTITSSSTISLGDEAFNFENGGVFFNNEDVRIVDIENAGIEWSISQVTEEPQTGTKVLTLVPDAIFYLRVGSGSHAFRVPKPCALDGEPISVGGYAFAIKCAGDTYDELMELKGLVVDGITYDVQFKSGTCAVVFDGCDDPSDFTFRNEDSANKAARAIRERIRGTDYDKNPITIFGCEYDRYCNINTPFNPPESDDIVIGDTLHTYRTTIRNPGAGDGGNQIRPGYLGRKSAASGYDPHPDAPSHDVFAVWTIAE